MLEKTSRHTSILLELQKSNKSEPERTGEETLAHTFQSGGGHWTDPKSSPKDTQGEYKDSGTGTLQSTCPPKTTWKAKTPREMHHIHYKDRYTNVRQAPLEKNTMVRRQSSGTFAGQKGEMSEADFTFRELSFWKWRWVHSFYVNKTIRGFVSLLLQQWAGWRASDTVVTCYKYNPSKEKSAQCCELWMPVTVMCMTWRPREHTGVPTQQNHSALNSMQRRP